MRGMTNPADHADREGLPYHYNGVHPLARAYAIMRDEEPVTVYHWGPNNLPGEADADFSDEEHQMCVGMAAAYRLAGVI